LSSGCAAAINAAVTRRSVNNLRQTGGGALHPVAHVYRIPYNKTNLTPRFYGADKQKGD